nr:act domain-containing protein ds12, chloroplastic [Quercus suber]
MENFVIHSSTVPFLLSFTTNPCAFCAADQARCATTDKACPATDLLTVQADCPGLLVNLVKIITDINIAVQLGEFDTEDKNLNSTLKHEKNLKSIGSLKHKTPTGLEHAEKAAIVEADKQLRL